jgi:hypothetical protein
VHIDPAVDPEKRTARILLNQSFGPVVRTLVHDHDLPGKKRLLDQRVQEISQVLRPSESADDGTDSHQNICPFRKLHPSGWRVSANQNMVAG